MREEVGRRDIRINLNLIRIMTILLFVGGCQFSDDDPGYEIIKKSRNKNLLRHILTEANERERKKNRMLQDNSKSKNLIFERFA